MFFDLTFVVAVAQAASSLHHGLVEGHASDVLVSFPLIFFGIWWAWMNFTWFASAYDTDDAIYRLAVLVQLTGVLVVAAGVPRGLTDHDFGVVTFGYVIMRTAMVAQWVRAAAFHPDRRRCALRYAAGLAAVQTAWVARLALHDGAGLVGFAVLVAVELAIPYWAESAGRTPWHPGHIAERYGLFTLIVLGESVLSATVGVQVALDSTSSFGELAPVIVGGILIVFFMWWMYFDMPGEQVVARARESFNDRLDGAPSSGATGTTSSSPAPRPTGAGVAVAVDQATHHSKLTDTQAGFAVTDPGHPVPAGRVDPPLRDQDPRPDEDLRRPDRRRPDPGVELHSRARPQHRPHPGRPGRGRRDRPLLRAGAGVRGGPLLGS